MTVDDRDTEYVELIPVISENVDEVIISDKATSKLGIVVLDAGLGLWCFKDELGHAARVSC